MKYLSLILVIFMVSCKGSKDTPETESKEAKGPDMEPHFCDQIVSEGQLQGEGQLNQTYILHYELSEDCICVKYQYSGCNPGERLLIWDGKWNSDVNPEVLLRLRVRNAGLCEQLLEDSACFSIKKLQFVGNEVKVMINDPDNSLMVDFNNID